MTTFYRTTITAIGEEARDLLGGGMLILFAAGAPPELAEISVLHQAEGAPAGDPPPVGAELRIGELATRLTAIGETAWRKVAEMGHVVINFNGSTLPGRAGELYAAPVDAQALAGAVAVGATITISG